MTGRSLVWFELLIIIFLSMLKRPIKRLGTTDSKGKAVDVVVSVVPLSLSLIKIWSDYVQPVVDKYYRHDSDSSKKGEVRADVGWNWWQIASLVFLHNSAVLRPISPSGLARGLAIVIRAKDGRQFPIGMLTTVPKFFCKAFGESRKRGFAWYLSNAPEEVYTEILGINPVSGVATALMDCGIQASLDAEQDGTFLLHADPNGGDKLRSYYLNRKMKQLDANDGPVTIIWRRKNSDEYFHFDALGAAAFCAANDPRR